MRNQLGIAQAHERQLQWQVQQQAFDEQMQERGSTLQQSLDAAHAEVVGLQALAEQLQLRANFDGKVVDTDPALQPGSLNAAWPSSLCR